MNSKWLSYISMSTNSLPFRVERHTTKPLRLGVHKLFSPLSTTLPPTSAILLRLPMNNHHPHWIILPSHCICLYCSSVYLSVILGIHIENPEGYIAVTNINKTDMECYLRFHVKPCFKKQDKTLTDVITPKMTAVSPTMISRAFLYI